MSESMDYQKPFLYAIEESISGAWKDGESCVFADKGSAVNEVDLLNDGLPEGEPCYRIVPLYRLSCADLRTAQHAEELKATQAAALEMAANACNTHDGWDMHPKDYYKLIIHLIPPDSATALSRALESARLENEEAARQEVIRLLRRNGCAEHGYIRDIQRLCEVPGEGALSRALEVARLEGWHEGLKDDITQVIHSIVEERDDKLAPDAIALKQALQKAMSRALDEARREEMNYWLSIQSTGMFRNLPHADSCSCELCKHVRQLRALTPAAPEAAPEEARNGEE